MSVNQEARAAQMWPVLASVAKRRSLITYGQLGDAVRIHHRAVRYVLGEIQYYCMENRLPPLTILVVNEKSGRPGAGFIAWDASDIETGLKKVYAKNWEGEANPFTYAAKGEAASDLVARLIHDPLSAAKVYRLVKDRGIAQRIFRDALLKAYDGRCAFCGLSFEDALQGAHIISWSASTDHQKMAPSNGLLLCATHHRLFDNDLMTVGPDGKIVYYDPSARDGTYSEADRHVSLQLHGRPVRTPKDVRHRTARESWVWRYRDGGWNAAPWRFK